MKTSSIKDIRSSDLINRLVLDYNAVLKDNTTEEIGRVKQLWLDLKAHQVRSLTCASNSLDRVKHSFTWNQIKTIGVDIVLVTIKEDTEPEKPEELIDSVAGLEVWTDAGNKAGKLVDYCIDVKTGAIVDYLFVFNGWKRITNRMYRLPRTTVISVGKKRIIVSDTMVQNAQQYGESLGKKIHHASELFREDYAQTKEDLASVMEKLQEKTHEVSDQAKEKLSEFTDQVQEKFSATKTKLQDNEEFESDSKKLL